MTDNNFSVVITGEWPGTGQSTTATLLAEKLNFTRVYAGFLFRKFAHIWNLEKNRLTWEEFEQSFVTNQINLEDYPFTEPDFNENTLHQWQHQLKQVKTPALWDQLIDKQSLLALQKPGVVVEAKVGVLLDRTGLGTLNHLAHPVYKILLTCPPEISAHRIIKRKIQNGELASMDQASPQYHDLVRLTTNETIKRHLRDWERYEKIYGIKRSSIYSKEIIKISTAHKSRQHVVADIIHYLVTKQEAKTA
jgi:cytidylate kinase